MDAITLLKADHHAVENLLQQIKELDGSAHAKRRDLFRQIDKELTAHSKIEETIFYPALKKKAASADDDNATQEVLEAYEEHANVKSMLQKLESTDAADETYNAKLQVLSDLVKHHVHEEEHVMFRDAKNLMNEAELEQLGVTLAKAKEELLSVAAV